ncbi:hypothetical protein [Streptomyces sp. NPDC002205]
MPPAASRISGVSKSMSSTDCWARVALPPKRCWYADHAWSAIASPTPLP